MHPIIKPALAVTAAALLAAMGCSTSATNAPSRPNVVSVEDAHLATLRARVEPPDSSVLEAFELMNMMPEPCEELWNPASFAAKSTVLRLTYLEDGRFPVSSALRTLEERARHPERTRSACLADPREVSLPW